MDAPFAPRHTIHARFFLQWHPSCGHVTWFPRNEPLPEDGTPKPGSDAPRRRLPKGLPLCPSCQMAQDLPEPSVACLVGSVVLQRIAAIGFHRGEKERLNALHFQNNYRDRLLVFTPAPNTIESQIRSLAAALGCSFDLADTRVVPPIPGELPNRPASPSPPQHKIKHCALISCMSDGKHLNLGKLSLETYTPIGTIPWPPNPKDLRNLPDPVSAGLPPETPRRLCLPTIPELHDLGFTRDDFWGLLEAAADLDLTIMTVEGEVCGASTMRLLHRLPMASTKAPSSPVDRTPNRGGRPPSARLKGEEVLRLHSEGKSVAEVARTLGVSARSVRRILALPKEPAHLPS